MEAEKRKKATLYKQAYRANLGESRLAEVRQADLAGKKKKKAQRTAAEVVLEKEKNTESQRRFWRNKKEQEIAALLDRTNVM